MNPYISWNEDGDRIKIFNKIQFVKNTISKTKEYTALLRLLNIYEFVKVKSDKNDEHYKKILIWRIIRKLIEDLYLFFT